MKIPLLAHNHANFENKEDGKVVLSEASSLVDKDPHGGKKKSYKPVTHVIFDVDGTLLDTVSIYKDVLSKVLKKHDKKWSWELSVKTLGMRREETMAQIIEFYKLPYTPEQLSEELFRLTLKKISKAFMTEGAERLVSHLYKNKVTI